MPSHYPQILQCEIIALSDVQNWTDAKNEWSVETIFYDDDGTSCLCTYRPINKCCVIINSENGNRTTVGSVCVKKFLGCDFHLAFDALKRIKEDAYKAMNGELLQCVKKQQWLNDREYQFYWDTYRKRKLSAKQFEWRRRINEKVVQRISRTRVNMRSAG